MAKQNFQAKMDHLIRLLSTTSGTDKSFMLVQYSAILLRQLVSRSKNGTANKTLAARLAALSKLLSDARTTYRLWDLISIIQWLRSLNTLPPSGSRPVQIERLQVITMLIYYPLEHLYFLASKGVLPLSPRLINKAAIYSCRAWAAYTFLHFYHLWEELKLLEHERSQLHAFHAGSEKPSSGSSGSPRKPASSAMTRSLQELDERRAALFNGLIVNLAYTPLTLHWSLSKGLYKSDTITGICGLVAAVGQLRAGWKASAVTG
ncbi:hypothetical protein PCANC_10281 [Puccinia coronata f. sp. avenae]|nr:hypothetical protein PCASD_24944 [Puccinia coronata f. sp. avenae]PLW30458.1 hypothetical protein PCASD_19167 [Puccinia coronata f. sp. avenae]PLW52177.1 hypothetical protein PCANC_10281 [Puccinia coronata f. sp. avenae]